MRSFFSFITESAGIRKFNAATGAIYKEIKNYVEKRLNLLKPIYYKIADMSSVQVLSLIEDRISANDIGYLYINGSTIKALGKVVQDDDGIDITIIAEQSISEIADNYMNVNKLDLALRTSPFRRTKFLKWQRDNSKELKGQEGILIVSQGEDTSVVQQEEPEQVSTNIIVKRRGRPKKTDAPVSDEPVKNTYGVTPEGVKHRGRPRKVVVPEEPVTEPVAEKPKQVVSAESKRLKKTVRSGIFVKSQIKRLDEKRTFERYSFSQADILVLEKKIQKFNEDLKRIGAPEIQYEISEVDLPIYKAFPEYAKKHNVKVERFEFDEEGKVPIYHLFKLSFESDLDDIIMNDGYSLVGEINHKDNVIRQMDKSIDLDLIEQFRKRTVCDVCGTSHRREKTFLIKDESNGEVIQVGKSCLKDFMPLSLEKTLGIIDLFDSIDKTEGMEAKLEAMDNPAYLSQSRSFPIKRVIDYAHALILKFGYKGKNDSSFPTSMFIEQHFWQMDKPKAEVTDEIMKETDYIINWAKMQSGSLYFNNIKGVVESGYVSKKAIGLVASLVNSYLVDQANKKATGESGYLGEAGDKLNLKNIVCTNIKEFNNYSGYGNSYMVTFKDENGNQLVWWASSKPVFKLGDTIREFNCTVKGQKEYKGIKQTVIKNCRIKSENIIKDTKQDELKKAVEKDKEEARQKLIKEYYDKREITIQKCRDYIKDQTKQIDEAIKHFKEKNTYEKDKSIIFMLASSTARKYCWSLNSFDISYEYNVSDKATSSANIACGFLSVDFALDYAETEEDYKELIDDIEYLYKSEYNYGYGYEIEPKMKTDLPAPNKDAIRKFCREQFKYYKEHLLPGEEYKLNDKIKYDMHDLYSNGRWNV